jgi:RNA polymerase sigma factor (sigma-70 family)
MAKAVTVMATANAAKICRSHCLDASTQLAPVNMNQMPDPFAGVSDANVLLAFANGDALAARVLTARLLPRVLAQAMRMLANHAEAEDVAQDAMLRLWKQAPHWRTGEAEVTTWLYRVVANLCTDRLRKRATIGLDQVAEPADGAPSVVAQLQTQARMRALSDALAQLPARQAQAVALRHLEGLSNPQIAQIMDIRVTAVESLTVRGKHALAAIMAGRKAELGYQDD